MTIIEQRLLEDNACTKPYLAFAFVTEVNIFKGARFNVGRYGKHEITYTDIAGWSRTRSRPGRWNTQADNKSNATSLVW